MCVMYYVRKVVMYILKYFKNSMFCCLCVHVWSQYHEDKQLNNNYISIFDCSMYIYLLISLSLSLSIYISHSLPSIFLLLLPLLSPQPLPLSYPPPPPSSTIILSSPLPSCWIQCYSPWSIKQCVLCTDENLSMASIIAGNFKSVSNRIHPVDVLSEPVIGNAFNRRDVGDEGAYV